VESVDPEASKEFEDQVERILRELGRLAFNFSGTEHQLRRLAWALIDPQADRTGEITLDKLGANGLEELVLALAPYRLSETPELSSVVVSTVKRFGELRSKRNDYIHSVWGVPNEAVDLAEMGALKSRFRRGTQEMVLGTSEKPIAEVASELGQIGSVLTELRGKVVARLRDGGS
jgi:hypothetical protein